VRLSRSTWQQPVPARRSASRSALVDDVAARVVGAPGRRVVVVDGPTGAGKTSFAHEVGEAVERRGRPVLRASLDDFKRPWAERHRYDRESGEGYYRNAFDLGRVRTELVAAFRTTDAVALCGIDPITQVDHGSQRDPVGPEDVLLVDGVFALRPELVDLWDLSVRLVVPPELALTRGIGRDTDREGTDAARRVHATRYAPAERCYVRQADPDHRADLLVDNADLDRPLVLDLGR
jgi:uridine kinase